MGPGQTHELIYWLLPIAVFFGVLHHFFSHTKLYERLWFIPAIGFGVSVAAVYFEKFDDCKRYPLCLTGWAERHQSDVIDAKVEGGPLLHTLPLGSRPEFASKPVEPAPVLHVAPKPVAPVAPPKDIAAPKAIDPRPAVREVTVDRKPAKSALPKDADPICPPGLVCSPAPGQRGPDSPQPTAVAAWSGAAAADPLAGLKASLKGELRRLNCLKGGEEASWGKDAVSAINRFNVYGYTKASAEPDEETLQMLKSVKDPVCP